MKPMVMFATPVLHHSTCIEYVMSIEKTEWLLARAGITTGHMHYPGDCFIAKVRNKIVTDFLELYPDATDLFFIDDDVGWPAEKVLEFLSRPEDVIAGAYPKRSEYLDFPCGLAFDQDTGGLIERNGLYLATLAPAGFMRIKRHVLEKLAADAEARDRIFFDGDRKGPEIHQKRYYGIFEAGIGPDKLWWGEDFVFTQSWMRLGGEIWIDPNIPFSHRGSHAWKNNLADHLDVYREKGKAAMEQIKAEAAAEAVKEAASVAVEAQEKSEAAA